MIANLPLRDSKGSFYILLACFLHLSKVPLFWILRLQDRLDSCGQIGVNAIGQVVSHIVLLTIYLEVATWCSSPEKLLERRGRVEKINIVVTFR